MNDNGYGLWLLVAFNSVLFIVFAASFFHPKSKRDWRVLGGFSAFVVALFTEMYGYPLTVYLLTGPFAGLIPGVNLSHNAGHLWTDLIGWKGDPHVSPFHLASYVFIIGGFWLISAGWKALYTAQKKGGLATSGPYSHVRHPQYLGFILIMVGFLLQWPTLATLAMFPILLVVYRRLAIREEREVEEQFGDVWERYASVTPRFLPRRRSRASRPGPARGTRQTSARRQGGLASVREAAHGGKRSRRVPGTPRPPILRRTRRRGADRRPRRVRRRPPPTAQEPRAELQVAAASGAETPRSRSRGYLVRGLENARSSSPHNRRRPV